MAVSAFKSSSRRSTTATTTTPSTPTSSSSTRTARPTAADAHRRSRSVSAFSRRGAETLAPPPPASGDFLNKRDNPLFWSPDQDAETRGGGDDRRGRSAVRSNGGGGGVGARKEVGRSLSRGVDPGRRNRSVSRCPVSRGQRFVNSESEAESECSSVMKNRRGFKTDVESDGSVKKGSRITSGFDSVDSVKGLRTWSSKHSAPEASRESALDLSRSHPSTYSLFGVEEKTIKPVSEQIKSSVLAKSLEGDSLDSNTNDIYETVRLEVRRAISEIQTDLQKAIGRSSTSSAIATTNITDIPPDLVNPSAVELVLDIRREYAKKLEQSHERARKLRADLAVEEHRGLELSRILKDVLPDPKTPSTHKSRLARKSSAERRKMSKRLTDEAMAYFDECVSLSTFDSSDFSSQEDPPVNIVAVTSTPVTHSRLSLQESASASASNSSNSYFMDRQDLGPQDQTINISEPNLDKFGIASDDAARDWKSPFSFSREPTETPGLLRQDIHKYIRNSEKDVERSEPEPKSCTGRSNDYDLGEYRLQDAAQRVVFERVVMRNGIESGSLLLCSGGISVSCSPFSSFF